MKEQERTILQKIKKLVGHTGELRFSDLPHLSGWRWKWDVRKNQVWLAPNLVRRLKQDALYRDLQSPLNWGEIVHPDDMEILKKQLAARADKCADVLVSEHRLVTHSGESIWLLATERSAKQNDRGNLVSISGMYWNINDIKRKKHPFLSALKASNNVAEFVNTYSDLHIELERLQESEKEIGFIEYLTAFHSIVGSTSDPVFFKDLDMKYVYLNPAMENLLNISWTDAVAHSDRELFGDEAGARLESLCLRGLNEGIVDDHVRSPTGKNPTEFMLTVTRLRESSGNVAGVLGILKAKPADTQSSHTSKKGNQESRSVAMQRALGISLTAAKKDSTILILGESGCGKDWLARYIHDHSSRSYGPYFTVNCAALPSELAESELFGHEPGAFSGANARKRGLLEQAENGTLVLNEIGELSLPLQAKLLTFLDTKSFNRVGGVKRVSVNARLIFATNRDLEQEVAEGRFRGDLYYRIAVLPINVPPLRNRREDIPIIVREIMRRLCDEQGIQVVPDIAAETWNMLFGYDWPGNVRQLRNVLERALILLETEPVTPDLINLQSERRQSSEELDSRNKSRATTSPPFGSARKDTPEIIEDLLHRSEGNKVRNPSLFDIQSLYQECHRDLGWSYARIGRALSVDTSTVSRWFSRKDFRALQLEEVEKL